MKQKTQILERFFSSEASSLINSYFIIKLNFHWMLLPSLSLIMSSLSNRNSGSFLIGFILSSHFIFLELFLVLFNLWIMTYVIIFNSILISHIIFLGILAYFQLGLPAYRAMDYKKYGIAFSTKWSRIKTSLLYVPISHIILTVQWVY